AVLTALALMAAYVEAAPAIAPEDLGLLDPVMLPGILIGAVLPYLFAALTMTAVGKAAMEIVREVRRQFTEIPGIMEGTSRPDYKTCVSISTKSALREMVIPGGLAVVVPLLVGYILGAEALAGMLIGAIASEAGIEMRSQPVTLERARAADELIVVSTAILVMPPVAVDDEPVGGGATGPVGRDLAARLRRRWGLSEA
ncbi:MAG: sodium/proton-translocating pyrophosphatase, partial [Myxococcota bacterium]